jgi:hypothetical protein
MGMSARGHVGIRPGGYHPANDAQAHVERVDSSVDMMVLTTMTSCSKLEAIPVKEARWFVSNMFV